MPDIHETISKDDPVWKEYILTAEKKDRKFLESRHKLMDAILVFAGLLSAVNTSFVLDIQQKLDPISTNETTNRILLHLSLQLQDSLNNNINSSISAAVESQFHQIPSITVLGTVLYHLSLAFSVLAAAGALLVKLWLLDYEKRTESSGSPYDQSMRRHSAAKGLSIWGFYTLIQVPVILLLVSIFFFLVGFYVSTVRLDDKRVSVVVGVIIILAVDSAVIASVAAELFPDCPYSSPITTCLHRFLDLWWPKRGNLFDYGVVLLVEGVAFTALVMVMMAKSSPDMLWLAFGLLSGWATSTWLLIVRKPIPFTSHTPLISLPLAVTIGTLLTVLPIPLIFIGGEGPITPSGNVTFLVGLILFSSIFAVGVFAAIPTGITPAIHFPKEEEKDKVTEALTSLVSSLNDDVKDRDRIVSIIARFPDTAYRQIVLLEELFPLLSTYLGECFRRSDGGPRTLLEEAQWELIPGMVNEAEVYVRCMVATTRDLIPFGGAWMQNVAAIRLPPISNSTAKQLQYLAGLTSNSCHRIRILAKAACLRLTSNSSDAILFEDLEEMMSSDVDAELGSTLPHLVATCVSHRYHLADNPVCLFKPDQEARLVDYFMSRLEGLKDRQQHLALSLSVILPISLLVHATGESALKDQQSFRNSFGNGTTKPRLWLRMLKWTMSSGFSPGRRQKDRLLPLLLGHASRCDDPDWIWTMRNSHSIDILLAACLDGRLSINQRLGGLRDVAVLLAGKKTPNGADDRDFARMHLGKLDKVIGCLNRHQALESVDLRFWLEILLRLSQNVPEVWKYEGYQAVILKLRDASVSVQMELNKGDRISAQLDDLIRKEHESSLLPFSLTLFRLGHGFSWSYWRRRSGHPSESALQTVKVEASS